MKITLSKISALFVLVSIGCIWACHGEELRLPLFGTWWKFNAGQEFPGALGKLDVTENGLRLDGDFRNGGDYVMAELEGGLRLPGAVALQAEVRTNGNAITVRVQDGSGKMHQYKLPVKSNDGWQKVELPLVFSIHSWGGPNVQHFDVSAIRFLGLLVRAESSGPSKCSFLEIRELKLTGLKDSVSAHYLPSALNPESLLLPPGGELRVPLLGVDGKIPYTLKNYSGQTVAHGILYCENNEIRLKVSTTPGYFDLQLAGDEISFVVAEPFCQKPDSYWGIDESFSWWGQGGDFRRNYMRFLVKSGITWGRDRMQWRVLHPQREKITPQSGDYEKILGWSAQEGLQILDVFHDAPGWNTELLAESDNFMIGANSKTGYSYGSNVFPRDYQATSDSWRFLTKHFPAIKAMEVWNEPDIGFGNGLPAEFFIALTRNFSTTYRLAGLSTKVIGGVLAIPQETTPYYHNLIIGGLLDDCDAFSFHTYRNTEELETQIRLLRKQEIDAGRTPGFPFWITESGRPWPFGFPRPELRQGMFSAQEIAGKGIEFRALGIRKYFPFFVIWHTEQNIFNFSMFDQRHAPLRSMAAYMAAVRILSHKDYIGDMILPGSDRCRVFSDGKTAVVWVYKSFARRIAGDWGTLDPEVAKRTHIKLPKTLAVKQILGADGRFLEAENGELPMEDGFCYLILPEEAVRSSLKTDTTAMKLFRMAQAYLPAARSAKNVVIQPDYDLSRHQYTRDGIFLQENEEMDLRIIFNNLSNTALNVIPAVEPPEGITVIDDGKQEMQLEARESKVIHFRLKADSALPAKRMVALKVSDRNSNASPLVCFLSRIPPKPAPLPVQPKAKIANVPFQVLAGPEAWNSFSGQWTGRIEPDISAQFRFTYDRKNLYLDVLIEDRDGHFCDYEPMMAWLGDSVQVALAGRDRKIEFCASAQGTQYRVYQHIGTPGGLANNIQLKWNRNEASALSRYHIVIPASELGFAELKAGMSLRASLLLNSGGPDGRHGFLIWGDGIRNSKNEKLFNELLLQ